MYYTDAHTLPGKNNDRATWLSKLIRDVKPDVVINGGDQADMESLCSYDKGTKNFIGRTYQADIEASLEFEDKVWSPIKKMKKKMPRRIFLVGNHENRIQKAIDIQTELTGTIGLSDLGLKENYDDIVEYNGSVPGVLDVDGVAYAHYFVAGVSGRPLSGSNIAGLALSKAHGSLSQGHAHTLDYCTHTTIHGGRIHSLVGGCFVDYNLDYAGDVNRLWFRGCFVKRNVDKGDYDLEVISMDRLKKEYG